MVSPVILATWPFGSGACAAGWPILAGGGTALDAVEAGANEVELDPRVNSVGYGGLPNAEGTVELDAVIMDGRSHSAGAVAGITRSRRPISVARRVMEQLPHVFLVGQNADRFATQQGFPDEELLTDCSRTRWNDWMAAGAPSDVAHFDPHPPRTSVPDNHDTVGICALDSAGNLAGACTTSGMAWKVPGRVGDSPIVGSGLYVDNSVGAAAATGHGDEIMKACVTFHVVMLMGAGMEPQAACETALRYLMARRPPELHAGYGAAVIALRKDGKSAACATSSGFRGPDRLWNWAITSSSGSRLNEGPYVTPTTVISSLL